jgi:tyrosyl-tRNA synthetase
MSEVAKREIEILSRGCVEIIQKEDFVQKIEQSVREKKPLRVKAGFDPTASDLHLGHTVLLYKMKAFQELGHTVIFLIGDFTGTIGDPSGRSETRKALTKEEVLQNARTYQEQAFKILDREKTVIEFNSRWMAKMTSEELIGLSAHYSVARMLERDDFQKRYQARQPISIHEFLYPLIQGYDSVALKSDIEIGGTDQKFNLLVGRDLQRSYGIAPQVVMTMPLLEGTDGVRKMSKSYGNSIGLTEGPVEMYGKVMSVNDTIMLKYYELLTSEPLEEIKKLHPMEAKKKLAKELVSRYYGHGESQIAETDFKGKYSQREFPEDLPVLSLSNLVESETEGLILLVALLVKQGITKSNSETRRLIEQGGVEINSVRMTDPFFKLELKKSGQEFRIKIGKKGYLRVMDT